MSRHWVEEIFHRYNLLKNFSEQTVLSLWSQIVGVRIAKLSQADHFAKGILYVEVASSTVAQELTFLKPKYIAALNAELEVDSVKEIRFIPGHFQSAPLKETVQPLSATDHKKAHRLFVHLDDPILRASFERLYLTLCKREAQLLETGGRRCPSCGTVFRDTGAECPGCRFEHIEEE